MLIPKHKDPMGAAIAEYHRTGRAGTLRVFSSQFDEDEIPVEQLFRSLYDMPAIEQRALAMARGKILDVGAGSGLIHLVFPQYRSQKLFLLCRNRHIRNPPHPDPGGLPDHPGTFWGS